MEYEKRIVTGEEFHVAYKLTEYTPLCQAEPQRKSGDVTDGRASLSNLGRRSREPLKKKKTYLKCPTPKLVLHLEETDSSTAHGLKNE